MSLPSSNANGQSSIRNFFRPKHQQPAYAPPPSTSTTMSTSTPTASPAVAASPPPQSTSYGISPQTAPQAAPPASPPAASSRPPSLHPQASISPVLPEHVPALRRVTSLILPVNYPDSFYARLSDPLSSGAFSRVLLWRDEPNDNNTNTPAKVIGGLVCRPEPSPFPTKTKTNALYIQSLVLLSPYRSLGLAAALLDEVTHTASQSPQFACETVYAHVWTENAEGLRWYLARGFVCTEEVKGYYYKLRPDSAWIVRREIAGGGGPPSGSSSVLGFDAVGRQLENDALTRTRNSPAIPGSVTAAAANLPLNSRSSNATTSAPTPPAPATTASTLSPPQPSSKSPSTRPLISPTQAPGAGTGMSYQNTRPETEWNDLPAEMHTPQRINSNSNTLSVPPSGVSSGASSRSSSAVRKKRDRAYPAAAFGK
ncbi:Uu.00g111640.m01.CDS01 [Anthostomella pinea]|uniref:Uu.00g111640.m01.CDS01 n=1 Tax=Anthostomella pinea TaxID=933095 RepID=A0AAI8VFN2_9PEZI|nr:Uu.00g111640.m01.CDS01 [Anthostomella pinea]